MLEKLLTWTLKKTPNQTKMYDSYNLVNLYEIDLKTGFLSAATHALQKDKGHHDKNVIQSNKTEAILKDIHSIHV